MYWYDKKSPAPDAALDLGLAENVQRCQVYRPAEMTDILEKIAAWMKVCGYPAKDVFAVTLAVHEATSNAFRHGNRGDSSKPVSISYLVTQDDVLIRVQDEGTGLRPGTGGRPLPSGKHRAPWRARLDVDAGVFPLDLLRSPRQSCNFFPATFQAMISWRLLQKGFARPRTSCAVEGARP